MNWMQTSLSELKSSYRLESSTGRQTSSREKLASLISQLNWSPYSRKIKWKRSQAREPLPNSIKNIQSLKGVISGLNSSTHKCILELKSGNEMNSIKNSKALSLQPSAPSSPSSTRSIRWRKTDQKRTNSMRPLATPSNLFSMSQENYGSIDELESLKTSICAPTPMHTTALEAPTTVNCSVPNSGLRWKKNVKLSQKESPVPGTAPREDWEDSEGASNGDNPRVETLDHTLSTQISPKPSRNNDKDSIGGKSFRQDRDVEEDHIKPMDPEDYYERTRSRLEIQTSINQGREDNRESVPYTRIRDDDPRISISRSHRRDLKQGPIDLSIFPTKTKRETKTYSRPKNIKQAVKISTFQDGRNPNSLYNVKKRRFSNKSRFKRRLSGRSIDRGNKKTYGFSMARQDICLQSDAFRALVSPSSIHQTNDNSTDSIERARDETSLLPRRYPNIWEDERRIPRSDQNVDRSSNNPGFHNQRKEIDYRTGSKDYIPRDGTRLGKDVDFGSIRKGKEDHFRAKKDKRSHEYKDEEIGGADRNSNFASIWVQPSLHPSEIFATKHNSVPKEGILMGPKHSDLEEIKRRDQMVVRTPSTPEWEEPNRSKRDHSHQYGCILYGLGILLGNILGSGILATERRPSIEQFQRAEGSLHDSKEEGTPLEGKKSIDSLRQHNDDCTNKQAKQSQASTSTEIGKEDLEFNGREEDRSPCDIYTRRRECTSGQTQSSEPHTRMETRTSPIQEDRETLRNHIGRLICMPSKRTEKDILLLCTMPWVERHKRPGTEELAEERVCQSTPIINQSDTPKIPHDESSPHPSNAELALPSVVGRMPKARQKETTDFEERKDEKPKKRRLHSPLRGISRVEIMAQKLGEGNDHLVELLTNAERASTRKTYDAMWERFTTFSAENNKDPRIYDVEWALKFLFSLKNKPSVVKQARSTISNVWNFLHPKEIPLGDHPLVQRFFKAIREENPSRPKNKESWNPEILIETMRTIETKSCSQKLLSTKTVTLLALASFWRPRSDLARIRLKDVKIDSQGLEIVATKPKEGDFKETRIERIEDEATCAVKTLEIYLERTKELRRNGAEGLFIGYRKPHKEASANSIARWVEEGFKMAGIKDTPHSLRSITSSEALKRGVTIERILSKANWKDARTFFKHYYRPSTKNQ